MSDFKTKMHQNRFRWGSAPDPARGAYSAAPDLLDETKGKERKGAGRKGEEREGKAREGRQRKGEGREREGK